MKGEARESVVVDSSSIVDLLIDGGPRGEAVAERLSGCSLLAPALLHYEVANVLRRLRLAGALSHAEASLAFAGLQSLPIDSWPFPVVADRLWEHGENLTAFDAAFVALAEAAQVPLVTADARLSRAPGVRVPIEVITGGA
ncbi:type II toxin-antitoxin system VapC family toxin [Leifsonia poae]|uniref:type II toxin-antitoxin system VapC family toxin n=1 Tax=Leifsonia poae TaxID=110933 RepID=UPI001CBF456A|nr:type II toxin-antitoxin system VapC family toxin [Leifsonia poae]